MRGFVPSSDVPGDAMAAGTGLVKAGPGTLVLYPGNATLAEEPGRAAADSGIKVYIDVVYNHTESAAGPRVIVFDGRTDAPEIPDGALIVGGRDSPSFDGFRGGVYVAAGDIDGAAILDDLLAAGADPVVTGGELFVRLQGGSDFDLV